MLLLNEWYDFLSIEFHVIAEFLDSYGLVFFFIVMFFDLAEYFSALSFASACYQVNVFGVNANSFHFGVGLLLVIFKACLYDVYTTLV